MPLCTWFTYLMGLNAPVNLVYVITQDLFPLRRVITFLTLMRTVFSDLEKKQRSGLQ